jgi:predicted aspartyl protease
VTPYNDADYFPAARVFSVEISPPSNPHNRLAAEALLDTGADVTILPVGIPTTLGLPATRIATSVTADGSTQLTPMWYVEIRCPIGVFTVEAAEIGDICILGRDILNRAVLRLDGPKKTVSVL